LERFDAFEYDLFSLKKNSNRVFDDLNKCRSQISNSKQEKKQNS